MRSGRMELGAATRIISTERKEVNINKTKTQCRVVQNLLLELSYWSMNIVDVDLGLPPNQTIKPFFSPWPFSTLSESECNEQRPRDSDSPFHLA